MTHVSGNKIGRFMVAVGAIIEHRETGKILVCKRTDEWLKDQWELTYGRIDQHEELEIALKREVNEETGITDLEIIRLNRIWHLYRGEKAANNELFGFTFHCQTSQSEIVLSDEHSAYEWVTINEALKRISSKGIKEDLIFFQKHRNDTAISVSNVNDKVTHIFNATS